MEISTFELLVKRIAPVPPPTVPGADALAAVARRVVQGYFLTIANLEERDFTYQINFHISAPNPADPDRTLAGNAVVFYDIAGANTPLALNQVNATTFTTRFRLPAKQTASLQLLPDISQPALINNLNADLEVRGFAQILLPAVGGRFPFLPVAQSRQPVKVLLNPEIRGTFLPNDFPRRNADFDFDQINYPLELASGKGLNEIQPEPGIGLEIPRDRIPDLIERLPLRERPSLDFEALTPEARSAALVELIGQIEPTEENLENVSDLLSKLEIPVRMQLTR